MPLSKGEEVEKRSNWLRIAGTGLMGIKTFF